MPINPYISCNTSDLDTNVFVDGHVFSLSSLKSAEHVTVSRFSDFHPALIAYFRSWVLEGDVGRANLIRSSNRLRFINYGDVEVSMPPDWDLGQPGQDNLSWQLHSMFFLKDLVRAHRETKDDWYMYCAETILQDWSANNVDGSQHAAFAWNDHSTAFRLFAISMLYIYCITEISTTSHFARALIPLIIRHQLVLSSDDFYVRGNNHGLDQAFYLYISLASFDLHDRARELKCLALDRLRYELMKSFAPDGVHVENSPEYHDLLFTSVLKINQIVHRIEGESAIDDLPGFIGNGLRFLSFMLRPDGCWPAIGDSTIRPPRSDYAQLRAYEGYEAFAHARSLGKVGIAARDSHAAFPESGYFVMRSNPNITAHEDRIHLAFKCGFLNHYHRQDDDNHFVLYGFKEEWLTDGGLYKHDHTDEQREYLRSHLAHNVLAPAGIKARRRSFIPAPRLVEFSVTEDNPYCRGSTHMFEGFEFLRRINFDGKFTFVVFDEITATRDFEKKYHQYWQIPADKSITISGRSATVRSKASDKTFLEIAFDSSAIDLVETLESTDEGRLCNRSLKYGELEPVQVIRITFPNTAKLVTKTTIRFQAPAA